MALQLRCTDYTVAWISPLPLEMTAAMLLLDGGKHRVPEDLRSDQNSYAFGSIRGQNRAMHNVVIAALAEAGTAPAARVAARMLLSFPSLKFGLLVGIGGGVPSQKHPIRLGDVVVSTPHDQYGGIVEYDNKKTLPDGKFIAKGLRNRPHDSILTAVNNLKSCSESEIIPLAQHVQAISCAVKPELQELYNYPGKCRDPLLVKLDCMKSHGFKSSACTTKRQPTIFYGTIASGNQLMRDEIARDNLINDYKDADILCFEMEGAGVMDQFPCLVIRGISDYADRKKNDDWHRYASATAAAYAKVLLGYISPPETSSIRSIESSATSFSAKNAQLVVVPSIQDIIAQTTTIAAAQQFGSPLFNRYTRKPMHEIILALNNNTDILSRRYSGRNIYEQESASFITAQGDFQTIAMSEIILEQDGEAPTQWDSIIICLSVTCNIETLSIILASAIMLYVHSTIERPMEATISILRGKIRKHANSVLSRESMCKKLEDSKNQILKSIMMRTDIDGRNLFMPPSSYLEEGDFIEFLAQILGAKADGVEVYTRSIKLLGLALLLTKYGWEIDIYIETNDGDTIELTDNGGLLKVVYSLIETLNREYVENHKRHLHMPSRPVYPSATCKAINMGEVTGLNLSKNDENYRCFMKGYFLTQKFWKEGVNCTISVGSGSQITMSLILKQYRYPKDKSIRDCQTFVERYYLGFIPNEACSIIVTILDEFYPGYDWSTLSDAVNRDRNIGILSYAGGNEEKLWVIAGVALGFIDQIILSLVNIPDLCLVRTIATDDSFYRFLKSCDTYLRLLLAPGRYDGLEVVNAIEFCATRLAGLDPRDVEFHARHDVVGYWNSQQGILITPIFERCLYCDLPLQKARPLTFHNIPMIGIPTDDAGWIRAATLKRPEERSLDNREHCISGKKECKVIFEYRPFFERDSRTLIAAAYLDGVFFYMISLGRFLFTGDDCLSTCDHEPSDKPGRPRDEIANISLRLLETGSLPVPGLGKIALVGPQTTRVSRLFSVLAYGRFGPIVQNGCLECAVEAARKYSADYRQTIVVPNLEVQNIS